MLTKQTTNYRTISILSCFSKILENIMYHRLMSNPIKSDILKSPIWFQKWALNFYGHLWAYKQEIWSFESNSRQNANASLVVRLEPLISFIPWHCRSSQRSQGTFQSYDKERMNFPLITAKPETTFHGKSWTLNNECWRHPRCTTTSSVLVFFFLTNHTLSTKLVETVWLKSCPYVYNDNVSKHTA